MHDSNKCTFTTYYVISLDVDNIRIINIKKKKQRQSMKAEKNKILNV